MSKLLSQLRQRRKSLGLKQADMLLKAGMSRQQYNRLETKGNPRLDTLELLASGLSCEVMLVPKEKLALVKAILTSKGPELDADLNQAGKSLVDDPWQGLLDEDES